MTIKKRYIIKFWLFVFSQFPPYLATEFPHFGFLGFGLVVWKPLEARANDHQVEVRNCTAEMQHFPFTAQCSSHLHSWLGTAWIFYQNVPYILETQVSIYGIPRDLDVLLISRTQSLHSRLPSSATSTAATLLRLINASLPQTAISTHRTCRLHAHKRKTKKWL